jgi:hypothetical protein
MLHVVEGYVASASRYLPVILFVCVFLIFLSLVVYCCRLCRLKSFGILCQKSQINL